MYCTALVAFLININILQQGYDANLLPGIFSQAVIANSLIAILSGLVAQISADRLGYTYVFFQFLRVSTFEHVTFAVNKCFF